MTLTAKTMEWLNQNRRRSYPMCRQEWRRVVSPESNLDCVLLDAVAFNSDASGSEQMILSSVEISDEETRVRIRYGNEHITITLTGGELSGEGSYECVRAVVKGARSRNASLSASLSSHRYILEAVGTGKWDLECPMLQSRSINLTDGMGVDGISVNGSRGIYGHDMNRIASGHVVLEDGYRTSPIIHRDRIVVRVGRNYGYDPCMYDYGYDNAQDCREPMFFFCGQNAVNGGNVILKGGVGISVTQGGSYKVRTGTCAGKTIPCIEITAGRELMDMYNPDNPDATNMI